MTQAIVSSTLDWRFFLPTAITDIAFGVGSLGLCCVPKSSTAYCQNFWVGVGRIIGEYLTVHSVLLSSDKLRQVENILVLSLA